jgi:hypothetical protein
MHGAIGWRPALCAGLDSDSELHFLHGVTKGDQSAAASRPSSLLS